MPKHMMLDLETMGTGPDAAIVAIGAVEFDPVAGTLGQSFYEVLSLASSVADGGTIDANTVVWWMDKSDEARRILQVKPQVMAKPAWEALHAFATFCEDVSGAPENLLMWGNGADFDNVILASAFKRAEFERPWGTWNNRCYRTLKSLVPVPLERSGTHHNALDDAITQATHACAIFKALRWQNPAAHKPGASDDAEKAQHYKAKLAEFNAARRALFGDTRGGAA